MPAEIEPGIYEWCDFNSQISFKHSKINNLTKDDLKLICAVKPYTASAEDVEALKTAEPALVLLNEEKQPVTLKATPDFKAFEVDGLPFRNEEMTAVFSRLGASGSP